MYKYTGRIFTKTPTTREINQKTCLKFFFTPVVFTDRWRIFIILLELRRQLAAPAIELIVFCNAHRTQNPKQSAHCAVLRKLIERLDKTSGGNAKLPLLRHYELGTQGITKMKIKS